MFRRTLAFVVMALFVSVASAESLEERVKSLENQVAELQAMIAKLSIATLQSNAETNSQTETSTEDQFAALMFLAAMKNAMDESQDQSKANLDCIKELGAKTTVLEQNSSFTTVGWMLKYESTCDEVVIAKVNIEWYTDDDFLVERDTAYARFEANTSGQANGEKQLFSTEKYEKVDKYKISVVR